MRSEYLKLMLQEARGREGELSVLSRANARLKVCSPYFVDRDEFFGYFIWYYFSPKIKEHLFKVHLVKFSS